MDCLGETNTQDVRDVELLPAVCRLVVVSVSATTGFWCFVRLF